MVWWTSITVRPGEAGRQLTRKPVVENAHRKGTVS
jgi:hypothetical protein